METKPLLYGIIGFILGALLVSIAATTFDKPSLESSSYSSSTTISYRYSSPKVTPHYKQ
jgi:hypothetical protein